MAAKPNQRVPAVRWDVNERVYAMCALPGGRLFVGSAQTGDINVYDPRNGRKETVIPAYDPNDATSMGHTSSVLAVTYMGKLGLFTSGADAKIIQWKLETFQAVQTYTGHKGLVGALCVIPSHYGTGLFSGSDDRTIKQWNTNTGKCVVTFRGHKSPVNCMVASDRYLYSGSKCVIKVWSLTTRKCLHQIDAHSDAIWSLKLTIGGELISGSSDSTIKVWEDPAGKPECMRVLMGHQGQVRNMLIWRNTLFSCSKDGTVACWDMNDWKVTEVLVGHEKTVTQMTLQNNQLCTSSFDKHINRWDVTSLLDTRQTVSQFVPYDQSRVEKERRRQKRDKKGDKDEKRFYSEQKKRALIHMDPKEAVFHYDALPLNYVIDKLEFKVRSSALVLDSLIYIPFLIMFVFFFLAWDRAIEQTYFISQAAVDVIEGRDIERQPWCTLDDGRAWDNPMSDIPVLRECNREIGLMKVEKKFIDIANAGDWGDWVMGIVFPYLFPGAGTSPLGDATRDPPTTGGKYLIGAMRFRTLRVTNESCSPNTGFFEDKLYDPGNKEYLDFYSQCFGLWEDGTNDEASYACAEPATCRRHPYPTGRFEREAYLKQQRGVSDTWANRWFDGSGFKYFSEGDIGGTRTIGKMTDSLWPPGGYTVEVPFRTKPNDARDMFAAIVDNGYVDNVATRFVTIEYMTYTTSVNYFSAHRFFVEIAPGGAWLSEGNIKNFRVYTPNMVGKRVYDIFFLIFVLYYCYKFIQQWVLEYRLTKSIVRYMFSAWNFLEFVNLICFLVTFGYRIQWWVLSDRDKDIAKMPPTTEEYPAKLDDILDAYMAQVYISSINTVLTFLKILKFVRLNDRLNILTRTLAACQQSIIGVLILFIWVVLGFAITGNSLFGGGIFEYRDLNTSFSTLLRQLLGDFDYEAMREENMHLTLPFFWTFEVLGLFLLLNFLIAVISDAFAEVSSEQSTIDLDAALAKTVSEIKSECTPASIDRRLRLLKHRKTQSSVLERLRQQLIEHRNSMITDEEVEAQQYRELLDGIFIHKSEYYDLIPDDSREYMNEDFVHRVWLDIAWEYNKDQRDNYQRSEERKKLLIVQACKQQVGELKEKMATVQEIRGRIDDMESRVRPLVQSWQLKHS
eukprot:TRINITY_DN29750_c0_g1_i1.p1 TRINITY_DN29750_c0_g1~~TRINITY_DN29750_c0_g1_i1.p1  ORF type:complete len:1125 (+),score=449.73 TRINITY_DN29750_c0_g1_i1:96-3470(+)